MKEHNAYRVIVRDLDWIIIAEDNCETLSEALSSYRYRTEIAWAGMEIVFLQYVDQMNPVCDRGELIWHTIILTRRILFI